MATGKGLRTSCSSREVPTPHDSLGSFNSQTRDYPAPVGPNLQLAAVVVVTKKFVTSPAHRQGFDPIGRYSCGYPTAMLKSVRL
jgi:hypothetical protein